MPMPTLCVCTRAYNHNRAHTRAHMHDNDASILHVMILHVLMLHVLMLHVLVSSDATTKCTCTHTYIRNLCVREYTYIHTYAATCVYICTHTYMNTLLHTYKHATVYTHTHTCVCVSLTTRMHECAHNLYGTAGNSAAGVGVRSLDCRRHQRPGQDPAQQQRNGEMQSRLHGPV